MTMCKLSVYLLLIINLSYMIDGDYQFQTYLKGKREEVIAQSQQFSLIEIVILECFIDYQNRCKRDVKMMIYQVRKQINCMPRTTLVKLVLDNEYTYYPNVIPLKRCHGNCHFLSCLPVANKTIPIYLERSHINSNTVSCVAVYVEEHTRCKCGCEVRKEDCNNKQEYSERDCQCVCKNDEEKRKCIEQPNMIWDSKNCKCKCDKMEETCASGLMWLRDKCTCAKVIMIEDD